MKDYESTLKCPRKKESFLPLKEKKKGQYIDIKNFLEGISSKISSESKVVYLKQSKITEQHDFKNQEKIMAYLIFLRVFVSGIKTRC